MPRQKGWTILRFCIALAFLTLAAMEETRVQVSTPAPTGTAAIGTHWVRLLDRVREDPILRNGTKRELMVRFWYPSVPSANCRFADYSSPRVWAYLAQVSGLLLPKITTHSCLNAQVAEGSYPVLIFSHGYTGTFTDGTFLFEEPAAAMWLFRSRTHMKAQRSSSLMSD
jgi:hypothetical protein